MPYRLTNNTDMHSPDQRTLHRSGENCETQADHETQGHIAILQNT